MSLLNPTNLPAVLKRNGAEGLRHRLDALEKRRAAAEAARDEKVAVRNGVIEAAVDGDADARKQAVKLKSEINRLTNDRDDLDTAIADVKRRHDQAASRERLEENLARAAKLRPLFEIRLGLAAQADEQFKALAETLGGMDRLGAEIDQRYGAILRELGDDVAFRHKIARSEYVRDRLNLVLIKVGLWKCIWASEHRHGQPPGSEPDGAWLADTEAAACARFMIDDLEPRIKAHHDAAEGEGEAEVARLEGRAD